MKHLHLTLVLLALFSVALAQKKISLLTERDWSGPLTQDANRTTWTYTPQGVPDVQTFEIQSATQTWEKSQITYFKYRNYTILELQIELQLNRKTNFFDTIATTNYTYYSNGQVETIIRATRLTTSPKVLKDSLVYDANGHVMENHQFILNQSTRAWDPKQIHFYENLADGRVVKDSIITANIVITPFNTTIAWKNYRRQFHHYNAQKVLDSLTHDSWYLTMNNTDRWGRLFKEVYGYNNEGLVSEIQVLDEYNLPKRKTEYTYTQNDSVHQFINFIWNPVDSVWAPDKRGTYTYEDQLSVCEQKAQIGTRIFPNPVKDYLRVQLNAPGNETFQFALYSTQGQQLAVEHFTSEKLIHLDRSGIAPGMYHYVINDGKSTIDHGTLVFE